MNRKRAYMNPMAMAVIVLIGLLFHAKNMNDFPSGIHAWTQADHYALAKGFVRNDLNFFKPETYTLNHQFPHDWSVGAEESITAVDFPIHDYIPAIFMKVLDDGSPRIFRTYVLLYSFLGLFFLFKLAQSIAGDSIKALLVVLLAASSPIYIHYQNGFLLAIPCISNTIIGLWFYYRYLKSDNRKSFYWTILFLTFAALSRTTFAIPLIAVFGIEFLRIMEGKTKAKPKLLPLGLSLASILLYVWYNGHLRNVYGSIFLNHIKPATRMDEVAEIVTYIGETWLTHYFSILQYALLVVALTAGLLTVVSKKVHLKSEQKSFLKLVGLILLGCSAFAGLMLLQFKDHDYYFLDTFYLPILLLFAISIAALPEIKGKTSRLFSISAVCLFGVLMVFYADKTISERKKIYSWDRIASTTQNFAESDQYLTSLGVSREDKILVIDAYAPAIPFLLMDRKGFAVVTTSAKRIQNALEFNYDYVVFQNEFFLSDVYTNYPQIVDEVERVGSNGKIILAKRRQEKTVGTIESFLGFDELTPVLKSTVDFEAEVFPNWENVFPTDALVFSGLKSGLVSPSMLYAMTFRSNDIELLTVEGRLLLFSGHFFPKDLQELNLVVSIAEGDDGIYYESKGLDRFLSKEESWQKLEFCFPLPLVDREKYELLVYLYNVGKADVVVDDFSIKLYDSDGFH